MEKTQFPELRAVADNLVAPTGIMNLNEQCGEYTEEIETVLKQLTTLPQDKLDQICVSKISKSKSFYELIDQLAQIGSGFRLETTFGTLYHLPIRKWLSFKTQPIALDFSRASKLVGSAFESSIERWFRVYRNQGIQLVNTRTVLGPVSSIAPNSLP
jgi:hypothetical protein